MSVFSKACASGSSADTIVINNAKGNGKTWIQMFSNTRRSIGIYERFSKVQKGGKFEYKSKLRYKMSNFGDKITNFLP